MSSNPLIIEVYRSHQKNQIKEQNNSLSDSFKNDLNNDSKNNRNGDLKNNYIETCESTHYVNAVLLDIEGRIVEEYGDIQQPTFARSAIKFIQAIPFVESGAIEKYSLSGKMVALACASHLGEQFHTDQVLQWLSMINHSENVLECGPHWPYDVSTQHQMIRNDLQPRKIHNNCSGKHCGMVSTALVKNESPKFYSNYDHPVQVRLRQILSEVGQVDYDQAPWGVDGCGIPTYAIPLVATARSMLSLIPENKINSKHKTAADIITKSIISEPMMISGTQGMCSQIVKMTKGRVLAKVGAEGVYTAIIPEQGLSLALKTRDGASRSSEVALLHLLQKYKCISEAQYVELLSYSHSIIKNWAGLTVGEICVKSM